jgi:hypothetical protein
MGGWKRVERPAEAVREDDPAECPRCSRPTDSLKQYRCLAWCVFYLAGASWQEEYVRACPGCMRGHLARRCLVNLPLANLIWPVLVLPWTLALVASTYRKGHSPEVVAGRLPGQVVAERAAAEEVSWGRVWAVIAVLLCWLPVIGLAFVLLAYLMNRKSADWKWTASIFALAVSGLVHLALVVLLVVELAG